MSPRAFMERERELFLDRFRIEVKSVNWEKVIDAISDHALFQSISVLYEDFSYVNKLLDLACPFIFELLKGRTHSDRQAIYRGAVENQPWSVQLDRKLTDLDSKG